MEPFRNKYLKYKNKYLKLKEIMGGNGTAVISAETYNRQMQNQPVPTLARGRLGLGSRTRSPVPYVPRVPLQPHSITPVPHTTAEDRVAYIRDVNDIERITNEEEIINISKITNINNNLDFFINYTNQSIRDGIINKYNTFNYTKHGTFDKTSDIINNGVIIDRDIKPIGVTSANGFVRQIKLINTTDYNNYDLILKVSKKRNADNNYFEYFNGKCINEFKKIFPNFVYTAHQIVLTKSLKKNLDNLSSNIQDIIKELKIDSKFRNNIELNNKETIEDSCKNNGNSGILIENIPNSMSIRQVLDDPDFNNFSNYNYNVFCILFQIYSALHGLRNNFTHYDLHKDNILFIKLDKEHIIEYKPDFTLKNKTNIDLPESKQNIRLRTRFIPIIIDYGRAYVKCPGVGSSDLGINSTNFINIACDTTCNDNNKYDPYLDSEELDSAGGFLSKSPIYNMDQVKEHRDRLGLTKKSPYCNLQNNGINIIRDSDNNFREANYNLLLKEKKELLAKSAITTYYTGKDWSRHNPTYYINPGIINKSHDLRYIVLFIKDFDPYTAPSIILKINNIIDDIKNSEWKDNDYFGIKEYANEYNYIHSYDKSTTKIKTTTDFYIWLIDYYQDKYQNQDNIKDENIIRLPKINITIPKEFKLDSDKWTYTP
jgi:hypothetical protein